MSRTSGRTRLVSVVCASLVGLVGIAMGPSVGAESVDGSQDAAYAHQALTNSAEGTPYYPPEMNGVKPDWEDPSPARAAHVFWSIMTGATSIDEYVVEVSKDGGKTWSVALKPNSVEPAILRAPSKIDEPGYPSFDLLVQPPPVEHTWQWRVIAVNQYGSSAPSSAASLTWRLTSRPGPLGVSINNGDRYTNDPNVSISVRWPNGIQWFDVSNDGGFGNGASLKLGHTISWRLDPSGAERLPKTVYVRLCYDELYFIQFTDDIILDMTAPVVEDASASPTDGADGVIVLRQGKGKTYRVKLRARDKTSGVASMQFAAKKAKPGAWRPFQAKVKVRTSAKRIYVRVRDHAGNVSKWRKVK